LGSALRGRSSYDDDGGGNIRAVTKTLGVGLLAVAAAVGTTTEASSWQWSGGGGYTNGYGDFDQIDVARLK
jgi:hypothetical protein